MIHHKFDKCQQGNDFIQFYESQLQNYCCHVKICKDDEDTILRFVKRLHADVME